MSGLEKIISSIENNAIAHAQAIVAQASQESDGIAARAKAEAAAKKTEIEERTKREMEVILQRAKSTAQLEKRKLMLQAKQQMIQECVVEAKQQLLNESDELYLKTLLKMIKKYAQPKAGTIIFSPKDLKRIPKHFEEDLKVVLSDVTGASLTIGDQTRDIQGGFVLQYDEIEENCSFDALIAASKEYLQDEVSKVLFPNMN